MKYFLTALILSVTLSCQKTESLTTNTKSSKFTSLEEKIEFCQKYLPWQVDFQSLEYSIVYHDNSQGMISRPSDYSYSLYAELKQEDIQKLSSEFKAISTPNELSWIKSTPTNDLSDFSKARWFKNGNSLLAVNKHSEILYHISTH